jgi:hypothetical protein
VRQELSLARRGGHGKRAREAEGEALPSVAKSSAVGIEVKCWKKEGQRRERRLKLGRKKAIICPPLVGAAPMRQGEATTHSHTTGPDRAH